MFCNIQSKNIIQAIDVDSIYELPMHLFKEKLDARVLSTLKSKNRKAPNLKSWKDLINKQKRPLGIIEIGIVGKYVQLKDAYKSLIEALNHSGF